jgi:hypothetical protein
MSKYKIYLTEKEARAFRDLYENAKAINALDKKTVVSLLSIARKIEQQADWDTF